MNSCEYYQDLISRLVDGEVNRDEYADLMAHMKDCSRCNAMYAVFHDLSEIIAEEPEELPAGLHENIMAGVRRSAIEKQNRHRRGGVYKTILTAAACAALVLFSMKGLNPAERADGVVMSAPAVQEIQTVEETTMEAAVEESTEETDLLSPTPAAVPKAEETPAPSPEKPEPAAVSNETGTEPSTTPKPVRTAEPTAQPAQAAAPVQTVQPTQTAAPIQTEQPTEAATNQTADAVPEEAMPEAEEDATGSAAADVESGPAADNAPVVESAATAAPAATESQAETMQPHAPLKNLPRFSAAAPIPTVPTDADESVQTEVAETEEPEEPEEPEEKKTGVHVYGDENYEKLLELLSGKESTLPEGEADRTIVITYVPNDPYRDTQKVTVFIYGERVYYTRSDVDGETVFSAACSVSDLEDFSALMRSAETVQPSTTPAAASSSKPEDQE